MASLALHLSARIAAFFVSGVVAASDGPAWQVELAGTLRFPTMAVGAEAAAVPLRGLSGVAALGDGRWAAILDNSDLIVVFAADLSPQAEPRHVGDLRAIVLSARHDYEDLAVCPPALVTRLLGAARTNRGPADGLHLLVCEEDTPAIHLVRLADGLLCSGVPLPALLRHPRPNRGLEAVAVDPDRGHLWTASEEALPADGPAATADTGTVVRLVRLALDREERPLHIAYAVDPPHAFARILAGPVLSGVVALVALPDGRLIVLERSGGPGLPPFENRLYLVDPAACVDVAGRPDGLASRTDVHAPKDLLWRGMLGCNLEGLGLGPSCGPKTWPLVAISDNDGLDAPAVFAGFRLTSP
jgi:hypothetical protein